MDPYDAALFHGRLNDYHAKLEALADAIGECPDQGYFHEARRREHQVRLDYLGDLFPEEVLRALDQLQLEYAAADHG